MHMRFIAASLLIACAIPGVAAAQDWPTKPITMIVPFAPGGATDISARILAEQLSKELGKSVVVENRTGAAGNIGVAAAVKAPADGHTLLFATMGTLTTNPHLYKDAGFDVGKDLVPISKTFEVDHVLVARPSLGVKTVKDLLAMAKEKPGQLTYGTAGIGSSVQMFAVLLEDMGGVKMQQVPYKGSAEARVDVMAGNIDMVMDSVPSAQPFVKNGQLVALAVTSGKRNPNLPDVPTMIEAGIPGYDVAAWGALMAPAKTPPAVIEKLSKAVTAALANPDVVKKYKDNGIDPVGSTPQALSKLIVDDTERWGKIVKAAGIKIQ